MMLSYPEWENLNSNRNYPFTNSTSLVAADGLVLPTNFIIDLFAVVPAGTLPVSLIGLTLNASTIVGVFSSKDKKELFRFKIPYTQQAFSTASLTGKLSYITGNIVFGEGITSIIKTWSGGTHVFDAALETSTCIPIDPPIVTSVGIEGETAVLVGDVKLETGQHVDMDTEVSNTSIEVSATKEDQNCSTETVETCNIKKINGLSPDGSGNINIIAEDIWTLHDGEHKLEIGSMIADPCIKPFDPGLRGADGQAGPDGDPGPQGTCVVYTCFCPECPPTKGPPTEIPPGHPIPIITTLTPTSGPPGTIVTVTGTGLGEVTHTLWGKKVPPSYETETISTSIVSNSTEYTTTVPTGTSAGVHRVMAVNPYRFSNAPADFAVTGGPPVTTYTWGGFSGVASPATYYGTGLVILPFPVVPVIVIPSAGVLFDLKITITANTGVTGFMHANVNGFDLGAPTSFPPGGTGPFVMPGPLPVSGGDILIFTLYLFLAGTIDFTGEVKFT